jgi:hypothetical protein
MISLSTRRLRGVGALALIFAGLASAAPAQTPYPSRTITQLGTFVGEQLVLWEKLIRNAGIEKQ